MNGGIIALIFAGFLGFGVGAYLAATGERPLGIVLMSSGLVFQALALMRIRQLKDKDSGDAG